MDIDVLIRDSIYVMEVKSRAELDHVEYLMEKKLVKRILGRNFDKAMTVAVNVDREAYGRNLHQMGVGMRSSGLPAPPNLVKL